MLLFDQLEKYEEFYKARQDLESDDFKERFTADEAQECFLLVSELQQAIKKQNADRQQISDLLSGISNSGSGPHLTAEQKAERLEQARAIALDQFTQINLDDVRQAEIKFLKSDEAGQLPTLRLLKICKILIVDRSTQFAELDYEKLYLEKKLDKAIQSNKFSDARHYQQYIEALPQDHLKVQAGIDQIGTVAARTIQSAPTKDAEDRLVILDAAEDLLRLSLLGDKPKTSLQDVILAQTRADILTDYPMFAFKFAKTVAETADGDPERQVKSLDLMYDSLKAEQAAGFSVENLERTLEDSLLPWGVPLKSAIVQRFIDTQLTSLREQNSLTGPYFGPAKPAQG